MNKIYYFNPNDYGSQFFVCADSEESAKQVLLDNVGIPYRKDGFILSDELKKAAALEEGYILEVREAGEYFLSEIS